MSPSLQRRPPQLLEHRFRVASLPLHRWLAQDRAAASWKYVNLGGVQRLVGTPYGVNACLMGMESNLALYPFAIRRGRWSRESLADPRLGRLPAAERRPHLLLAHPTGDV